MWWRKRGGKEFKNTNNKKTSKLGIYISSNDNNDTQCTNSSNYGVGVHMQT